MKKIGFFVRMGFAVLAFALLSCTEKGELSSGTGREMELTVSTASQTKADDTPSEGDTIKSLQVFVFSNNKLEAVSYSESDNVTLRCFEGSKNIYAVVNHSEIGWTPEMTDEELLGTVLELKGPNDLNVMVGIETDMSLSMGTDDSPVQVEIEVKRVAARIVLRSVDCYIMEIHPFTVHCAYITNVVGDVRLCDVLSSDYSYEPEVWYNQKGLDENLGDYGDLESVLYSDLSVAFTVHQDFDRCFYCYPNYTKEDNRKRVSWSPRWTRLVVEGEFGGDLWYYVVPIGGIQDDYSFIQSNHSYEVSLVITGRGWYDAEGPIDELDDGNNEETPASVRSGDGVTVINFVGGRAEVRKL